MRIVSPATDAVHYGVAADPLDNFLIPDLSAHGGKLDIYASLLARCRRWHVVVEGSVTNGTTGGAADFSVTTNLSGSFDVEIAFNETSPLASDESVFVSDADTGAEQYPIRDSRSNVTAFGTTASVSVDGHPEYPSSLSQDIESMSGPQFLTPMTTQVVDDTEQAGAYLLLKIDSSYYADNGTYAARTWITLTTGPGHLLEDGVTVTTPVVIGTLTIEIPDWQTGSGTVSIEIPLKADTGEGPDNLWLSIFGTGGSDYTASDGPTGEVNITMTPAGNPGDAWPYEDSDGNPAWDDAGNLLLSDFDELAGGEPN